MANEKIVIFHHDERGAAVHWSEMGELVRCKDCKHLKQEFQWNGMPYKTCEFHGNGFPDDWYCADGERKDDEKNR